MTISELNHLEVLTEETQIQGGFADAFADAYADAFGNDLAFTATYTDTNAVSLVGFNAASSDSYSASAAI